MEKKMMFALAALAVATSAFAATFSYIPTDSAPLPYDWSDVTYWSPYNGNLPSSSDETWMTSIKTKDNPLYINSGTAAQTGVFRLSNSASRTDPQRLIINGGSLTTHNIAYLGNKNAGSLTIQNGGVFAAKNSVYIGTHNTGTGAQKYDAKVIVADASSIFSVTNASVYLGGQAKGLALLENHGTVSFVKTSETARNIYLGNYSASRTMGDIVSVIDNYGTMTAGSNHRYYIGGTSGQMGVVTNHTDALIDTAFAFSVGSGSNAVGRLVNEGTINVHHFLVGGNTYDTSARSSDPDAFAEGWAENSGTLNVEYYFHIGAQTNGVGHLENTGDMTGAKGLVIGYYPGSKGYVRHSAGTLNLTESSSGVIVGYLGSGYLELAGNTHTVIDKLGMSMAGQYSESFRSSGELVITNSASLSRGGQYFTVAEKKNSTARIALYDDAMLSDISTFKFGNVKTDNSFEVYDNAVVSNVNLFVLNVGSTVNDMTGTTRMKLSGNAKVCDIGNAYIGSNTYNRVELEIADNAWFGLRDTAWEGGTNSIHVARDSYKSGDVTIRLRGGAIGLGARGGLVLGSTDNNANVGCTGRLIGYGCITNQGDLAQTFHWSRLDIRGGSATADGEGVERDLDLRTFARISGTVTEGRSNLNVSGTNGWYAINKGRLLYPAHDSGDKSAASYPRFVGDYGRLAAGTVPKYVNSMEIIAKNASGNELTSLRHFCVELYAPDRTDIPAGLVEDGEKSRRLGVWRGGITGNAYDNMQESGIRSFTTATTTIRYDQWRLGELKDAQGNYPAGLVVRLYQYDGTQWKRIARQSIEDVETEKNYRISGDLKQVSGVYNLGWFAVVAECTKGTCISIR